MKIYPEQALLELLESLANGYSVDLTKFDASLSLLIAKMQTNEGIEGVINYFKTNRDSSLKVLEITADMIAKGKAQQVADLLRHVLKIIQIFNAISES